MKNETKVEFLQMSQLIADLNNRLLIKISSEEMSEDEAAELLQASQKLIQAQNNIIKSTK